MKDKIVSKPCPLYGVSHDFRHSLPMNKVYKYGIVQMRVLIWCSCGASKILEG